MACGYGTGVGESAVITPAGVHGFPATLTSFIGRARPVREVVRLLEGRRLVTVTGPGGSGKTRLACEVARGVAGRFADGAWLVELAPVQDPAQVAPAVAAGLGVREEPGMSAAEALARVLARQQLLLVLDNCEHVIGASAELCARLVCACDDVRLLVTSREPLAVAGEARYRLGPLALPSPDGTGGAGESEAVTLFVDRARSADAHFRLDGEGALAARRLVARLDGMPLAIELAAARVEALGVAQLLERLDDRFALLADGERLAADRHRSLEAAMAWSYQLLDGQQRRVFRQLSVFAGPFTLEGAESVAGEDAGPVVLRLVDCSLLSPPRAGPDGRARYVMLETLRAYGAGLLAEEGEQEQAAAALAGYAVQVARRAAGGLRTSAGELAAARWLDAEDATMRQVLAWTREHDPAALLQLAGALVWWWLLRGRVVGQRPLLHEAAGRAPVGSEGWCWAQGWLGWTAFFAADLDRSLGHFTALRDAVTGRPPSRALADGLAGRAHILVTLGQTAEGAEEARRALAVAREVGYPATEAVALVNLSIASLDSGSLDSAVQRAREAEQLAARIAGPVARVCSQALTDALTAAGDLAAAERVCAAALATSREMDDLYGLCVLLTAMAAVELQAGRTDGAAAHLNEALHSGLRANVWAPVIPGLDRCGHLCAQTGRRAEALTIWAAFAAVLRQRGMADAPLDASRRRGPVREARQALGDTSARVAEERGAAMSLGTAAEYALMLTAPASQRSAAAPGPGQLSARERELVTLVAQGRTDAEIAAQLHITVRTVSSHLDRIRDKTGCRRRADLTRLALGAGLV